MKIMIINVTTFQIVKVCETEEQATYWADILCGQSSYYINEISIDAFKVFSDTELRKLHDNHILKYQAMQSWTMEVLYGCVLNIANDMQVDTTTVQQLHEQLGGAPEPLQIVNLTHAQRVSLNGDSANAGKGCSTVQRVTGGATYAVKKPKEGSTTRKVWDKADELLPRFPDIKELRAKLVEWGAGEGINPSTVRTQYNHWRNFNKGNIDNT